MAERHLYPDTPGLREQRDVRGVRPVKRALALFVLVPFLVAAKSSDRAAVGTVLDKMIAGDELPADILDIDGYPDLPKAIEDVKGCKADLIERLQTGNYGVQWKCKGKRRAEQPSPMIIYVADGEVNRITTATVIIETTR